MTKRYVHRKSELLSLLQEQGFEPIDEDSMAHLTIIGYRKIPKSASKSRRAELAGKFFTGTPDVDNVAGAVMDSILKNDSGVVSLFTEKRWSNREDGSAYLLIGVEIIDVG